MLINFDDPNVCKITKTPDLMHYELSIKCPMCGEWHTVTVTTGELFTLRQTGSVNCLIKTHTASERELLLSGTCSKCWDAMFGSFGF